MDFHQSLKILGGLAALILFVPMVAGILKSNAEGQSCATWLLWGALDAIVTISISEQHGNFLLTLGFTIGDAAVVLVLLARGRFEWGRFETAILLLVLGCIAAWKFGGSRTATIASALGIAVAAIPGLVAMWKNPERKVGNLWAGFVVANGLSFLGGNAMTVEERFAPGVFALCSLAMFLASRRRPAAVVSGG